MNIESLYQLYLECCGEISTDSRNCKSNSLFFALRGDNFDGNKYADAALKSGAHYVVIDNPQYAKDNKQYILVEDSLRTLQELAKYHRHQLQSPIIGITGTNGKTTTKELIAAVLNTEFNIQYTKGNLNNHIGVPLTLLSIRPEHNLSIVEMGANHLGEIKFLCNIVEPDLGLITNVGKAHLEGFGSFEGVVKTKSELYDALRNKKEGIVFVQKENKILFNKAMGIHEIFTYGEDKSADIVGQVKHDSYTMSFSWWEKEQSQIYDIETQLVGNYNLPNALAAICIGRYFKISPDKINFALSKYTPQNNRSQAKRTKYNQLIIDAYNANPTSMLAALNNLIQLNVTNKVIILGDMKELGESSLIEHQKIVEAVKEANCFDQVIFVGEEFAKADSDYTHFLDVNELETYLKGNPIKDKTILIKGSNSTKLYTIVDLL